MSIIDRISFSRPSPGSSFPLRASAVKLVVKRASDGLSVGPADALSPGVTSSRSSSEDASRARASAVAITESAVLSPK